MNHTQRNNKIKKIKIPKKYLTAIVNKKNYYIESESYLENKEFIDCSFEGIIENSDFEQNHFVECSFNNFQISGFLLKKIIFDNCYIIRTCIKNSKIVYSEFNNSKLIGISFDSSIGSDITFLNCNSQYGDFRNTRFTKTIFDNCNLREACFQNADLRGVTFKNCDLREAQLSFAKLSGTNFCNSKIEGIKAQHDSFQGAIVDYSQAAYLGAKFLKLKIE